MAGGGFETEGVEGDEAGGVVLVVGFFLAAFHGGDGFGIHAEGRAAAGLHDVAFVELQADFPGHRFLGLGDEGLDGDALGGEPEAVVNELGVFRDEAVADVHGLAIDDEGFQVAVGGEEDGAAGGFVDAARFHADETVLDDVDAADAISPAEEVEDAHDTVGSEEGVAVPLAGGFDVAELGEEGGEVVVLEADGVAFFEKNLDVFGLVGGVFGGNGEDIHVGIGWGGGVIPGVFHGSGFEGDVEEVAVHGVGLFHGGLDRDVVGLGVGDHFGSAGEFLAETGVAPRGDAFHIGREGGGGELEADLVVAFSSGTVGDGIGPFGEGDLNHVVGDAGAGDGGAEEVAALVNRASLDHGENVIGGEVFLEVADEALGGAGAEGLGFEAVEFVALADIGAVGDDFRVVFCFQPEQEDGGIKTSRVGDDDFHEGGRQARSSAAGKRRCGGGDNLIVGFRGCTGVALFHSLRHFEIMEERYEIRGKIGQGGLGAVYRAYDKRMNREVAIKRISMANDDPTLQEESTRQLIKEAGALASLQHPHIVTIYDVGADEDGPYVVMELISGKTLDELIERAPLTWPDFRELALQTQEGLIAAQELHLIHSDIKPSNLMLTWLPSGKFQMKIVDFGLATLTQSQSLEELQEIEAVFGSIFFMAPEQFERVPLDARTDMYAMGCVYYQALTGDYPFKGETGHDVMVAHLHHTVVPIQEVRSDIPVWACDWIMWQINRMPADRPDSARHSLQVFLQNDKNPAPTMSLGRVTPVVPVGPRPRLVIPGSGIQPVTPSRPILDPRMAPPGYVAPVEMSPEPIVIPEPPKTTTAPQPLLPPEGSKPSIHTGPEDLPSAVTTAYATPTTPLNPTSRIPPSKRLTLPQKRTKSVGFKLALAAVVVLILVAAGLFLMDRIKKSKGSQRHDVMLAEAAKPETLEIPMSAAEYTRYLQDAADADTDETRKATFRVLSKAKPNDGADFNGLTAGFIIQTVEILPEVREALVREVLTARVNAAMVPALLDFARSTKDAPSAIAILKAIRPLAGDEQFEPFLAVAQYSKNADFQKEAEESAVAVIKRSKNRSKLLAVVTAALESATDPKIRESMLRVKAAGGG